MLPLTAEDLDAATDRRGHGSPRTRTGRRDGALGRTGLDLQDAGADRASQRRTGFAHRGATGARRRPAFPGARRCRRKEPGRLDDTASGRPCRRPSAWLADKAKAAQDAAGATVFDPKTGSGETRPGRSTGPVGTLGCRSAGPALPPDTPLFNVPQGWSRFSTGTLSPPGLLAG